MADECRRCGTKSEPHTPNTNTCTVCVRWNSVRSNAARVRRSGEAPGLNLDRDEFTQWFLSQDRTCTYCQIPERLLVSLELITQVGLRLQRLGVDRLDDGPYAPSNMALCCFACNKAKSNTFTRAEMVDIGKAISRTWQQRLADVGITWDPPTATQQPA